MKLKYIIIPILSLLLFSCGGAASDGPRTKEDIANDIKSDPEWFAIIQQKAEEFGISVDEMLARDAEYIYNQENGIVVEDDEPVEEIVRDAASIEAQIRKDPNWMAEEQKKADERGISLEEMIKIDVEYILSMEAQKEADNY